MTNSISSPSKTTRDTKSRQRFLDAAEFLFAEFGYEGTKIRAIAERSQVNLGALHHYWGSKEELFTAVCQRRLLPMNKQRIDRLNALAEQANDPKDIDIRELFRASLEPTFFIDDLDSEEQKIFRRFYGRALTEPSPVVGKVMREIFTPVSKCIFDLLRSLCTHLDDNEFYWRANCIFGTYLYTPAFIDRMAFYAHTDFDIENTEQGISEIIEFLVAGIMAPATKQK